MPDILMATIAQFAKTTPPDDGGSVDIIGAGWDNITAPTPVFIPLHVVLGVGVRPVEFHRPHRIELILMDQDGGRLAEGTFDFTADDKGGLDPGGRARAYIAVMLPAQFPEPGDYAIHVVLDDQEVDSLPFQVRPLPQPGE